MPTEAPSHLLRDAFGVDDRPLHVYPEDERASHTLIGASCWCDPEVFFAEDAEAPIILHHRTQ